MATKEDDKNYLTITRIFFYILGLLVVWLAYPFLVRFFPIPDNVPELGQFGDQYGALNALFSGFAFGGVIIAVLMQRHELALQRQVLDLQRQELADTRSELARAANAQEESQRALNKTIYAQTFKVALDILETNEMREAREFVRRSLSLYEGRNLMQYSERMLQSANTVSRNFDAIGTMVRNGILPVDYLMRTWSTPIEQAWAILRPYLEQIRTDRSDPDLGVDFEYLVNLIKHEKGRSLESLLS